jgi:hypothetical protein
VRELAAGGADVNAPQRELSMLGGGDSGGMGGGDDDSGGVLTLGRYDEHAPRALYLAAAQGHVDMCRLLLGARSVYLRCWYKSARTGAVAQFFGAC